MDIPKFDKIRPLQEPSGETSEEQGVEVSSNATILRVGAEDVDLVENTSASRPISPALASILESTPALDVQIQPAAPQATAVPFRENVEIPTQLPGDTAIDPGLSAFNIGDRNLSAGPNHFGIDLSAGGLKPGNVIADALKLRNAGVSDTTTAAPEEGESVVGTGLSAKPGASLYADGGMLDGIISWVKGLFKADGATNYATDVALEKFGPPGAGEAMQLLNAPATIASVTGDATDGLRGLQAFGTETRGKDLLNKVDQGNKYVNPDADPTIAPATQMTIDPGTYRKLIELRRLLNALPSNVDDAPPIQIDPGRVYDPLKGNPLVTDRNPEFESFSPNLKSPGEIINPEGPDTVNPNDPDTGTQPPPTEIPKNPRGGGSIS